MRDLTVREKGAGMIDDPTVRDVLTAAVNAPKKVGRTVLGARVPIGSLRRLIRAGLKQWLAVVFLVALLLWIYVQHLSRLEQLSKQIFAAERRQVVNTETASPDPKIQSNEHGSLWTFEELEAAGPVKSLSYNPAARSVATTPEEAEANRKHAAEVAKRSVIGAAFQEDNVVGSFFSKSVGTWDNTVDPAFDFAGYLKDNKLEGQADLFSGSMNKTYADGLLSDLRRKETNRETLAAAGWAGILATLAAKLLDLPGLAILAAIFWGRRKQR